MGERTISERIAALRRLQQKHTYRVLVVNGPQRLFQNLTRQLREEGYYAEELGGPDVLATGLSLDTLLDKIKKSDPEMHSTIAACFGDVQPAFQDEQLPDFVFANYRDAEEGIIASLCSGFVYRKAQGYEPRDIEPVMASLHYHDEHALHAAIQLGQAYKLFFYEYTSFIHEVKENGMLPDDIAAKMDCIGERLYLIAHYARETAPSDQELQQGISSLYDELQAYKLMYKPIEQDPLLEELEIRLCGAYNGVFHKLLEDEPTRPGTSQPTYSGEVMRRTRVMRQTRTVIKQIEHFRRRSDGGSIAIVISGSDGLQNIYVQTVDDLVVDGGQEGQEESDPSRYSLQQGLFALTGLTAAETALYLQKLEHGGLRHIILLNVNADHKSIPPEMIEAGILNYVHFHHDKEESMRKVTVQ
ncbi:hypothetical protein HYS47_03085 [Candidatus Woesearchaeota archaeon]|nr:hypothetical protein [Candidatus Woesearchaeota archaeon]